MKRLQPQPHPRPRMKRKHSVVEDHGSNGNSRSSKKPRVVLENIPYGLAGRCIGVYATSGQPDGHACIKDAALKESWQNSGSHCKPSIALSQSLLGTVPAQYWKYLPEVLFTGNVYEAKDLEYERTRTSSLVMGPREPQADERVCHVMSSMVYENSSAVKNVDEFKKVWLECVRSE